MVFNGPQAGQEGDPRSLPPRLVLKTAKPTRTLTRTTGSAAFAFHTKHTALEEPAQIQVQSLPNLGEP
jgi:hypothetical protein